jgi:hypothetical protein
MITLLEPRILTEEGSRSTSADSEEILKVGLATRSPRGGLVGVNQSTADVLLHKGLAHKVPRRLRVTTRRRLPARVPYRIVPGID